MVALDSRAQVRRVGPAQYVGDRLIATQPLEDIARDARQQLATKPASVCAVSSLDLGHNVQVLALRTSPTQSVVVVNPTVTVMPLEGTRVINEHLDACGARAGSRQVVRNRRVLLSFAHTNGTRDTLTLDGAYAYCAQTYVEMFTVGVDCV